MTNASFKHISNTMLLSMLLEYCNYEIASNVLTTSQLDSMIPSGSIPGGPSYVGCSLSLGPFFESPGH